MFESFKTVAFPTTAVAGDNQYVPFSLPDGERDIEITAWGNYPTFKGVYLFADRVDPTTMAAQLTGEVANDILLALGNQIAATRRLPDNVRGVTVYLEQAVGSGIGTLVVMIRLRECASR